MALLAIVAAATSAGADDEAAPPAPAATAKPPEPKLIRRLPAARIAHAGAVRKIAWCDAGRGLLSLGEDGTLLRNDPATGDVLWSRTTHVSDAGFVTLWAEPDVVLHEGSTLERIDPRGRTIVSREAGGRIFACAASPIGKVIAVVEGSIPDADGGARAVTLRRSKDFVVVRRWSVPATEAPTSIAFTRGGEHLVWTALDHHLRCVRPGSDAPPVDLGPFLGTPLLEFSPGGERLIALDPSADALYGLDTSAATPTLEPIATAESGITCVVHVHDDIMLLGTSDGRVSWSGRTVPGWNVLRFPALRPTCIACDDKSKRFAVGAENGTVRIYRFDGDQELLDGQRDRDVERIESVATDRDGDVFATSDATLRTTLWSPGNGRPIRTIESLGAPLAMSADGRLVAGLDRSGRVRVVRADGAETEPTEFAVCGRLAGLQFSTSGDTLFAGASRRGGRFQGDDGDPTPTLISWDLASRTVSFAIEPQAEVTSIALSPDGMEPIVSGLGAVRRFHSIDGTPAGMLEFPSFDFVPRWVHHVAVDVESGAFALEVNQEVQWSRDCAFQTRPRGLPSDPIVVHAMTWVPGGRHLVVGGIDGFAQIWDVQKGTLVRRWKAHSTYTAGLAVVLRGKALVTTSYDGGASVWDISDLQ